MDCEVGGYHHTICEDEIPLGDYQAAVIILGTNGVIDDGDVETGPYSVLKGWGRRIVRNWVRSHDAGVERKDEKENGGS